MVGYEFSWFCREASQLMKFWNLDSALRHVFASYCERDQTLCTEFSHRWSGWPSQEGCENGSDLSFLFASQDLLLQGDGLHLLLASVHLFRTWSIWTRPSRRKGFLRWEAVRGHRDATSRVMLYHGQDDWTSQHGDAYPAHLKDASRWRPFCNHACTPLLVIISPVGCHETIAVPRSTNALVIIVSCDSPAADWYTMIWSERHGHSIHRIQGDSCLRHHGQLLVSYISPSNLQEGWGLKHLQHCIPTWAKIVERLYLGIPNSDASNTFGILRIDSLAPNLVMSSVDQIELEYLPTTTYPSPLLPQPNQPTQTWRGTKHAKQSPTGFEARLMSWWWTHPAVEVEPKLLVGWCWSRIKHWLLIHNINNMYICSIMQYFMACIIILCGYLIHTGWNFEARGATDLCLVFEPTTCTGWWC